jgi:hypothetical protein
MQGERIFSRSGQPYHLRTVKLIEERTRMIELLFASLIPSEKNPGVVRLTDRCVANGLAERIGL